MDVARPDDRPHASDEPDVDRQRPGRGPPVHPLVRRQPGAQRRRPRRRARSASPRVLYIGYFLILPDLDAEALAERFAAARRAGTVTVLDVATPGPGDYLRHLRPVLPQTDVFLPNTDEAALILGETDPVRQALAFHDLGARRVVITRGEHGAVAVSDALRVRLGTYPVPFVDGSGGGDAFDAGYIARPARRPLRDSTA